MAHTCPECGRYCTCNGDWDDIDMGERSSCSCPCWMEDTEEEGWDIDFWCDFTDPPLVSENKAASQ